MSLQKQKLIITLASKNEGKRLELNRWLEESQLPIELALNDTMGDVEETGHDFIENALIKAKATPPVSSNGFVIGEDSGMVVDALDGQYGISPFPGLYSNRWLTPEIRDALLKTSFPNRMALDRTTTDGVTNSDLCQGILALMRGQANRAARYCCGMTLWRPEQGLCFQALESTELSVIEGEPRGANGFGYDPIVTPKGETRTMAELSTDEKNKISHRGRAFQKLLDYLRQQDLI